MIEELADAVAQDPSNDEAWAVYADYLLGVDPLVGERIALGLALVNAKSEQLRTQLRGTIMDHEHRHPDALLGATLAMSLQELEASEVVQLERRFGMVIGARIQDRKGEKMVELDAVFRALLASPAARVLGSLAIDVGGNQFVSLVDALATREDLGLRRLLLGAGERGAWYGAERLPNLQPVLDQHPRLDRLSLHAPFVAGATHSALRELELGQRGLGNTKWSLRGWSVPALETLHVHGLDTIDSPWVELPRLRRVLIKSSDSDALVASLVSAPWLAQLDSLILLGGSLSAVGIGTMITHADRFAAIDRVIMIGVLGLASRRVRAPLLEALPNVEIASTDWLERRAITKFGS